MSKPRSRKLATLKKTADLIVTKDYLTDAEKREEKRLIKKVIRKENRRLDQQHLEQELEDYHALFGNEVQSI